MKKLLILLVLPACTLKRQADKIVPFDTAAFEKHSLTGGDLSRARDTLERTTVDY